jgi:MFS family permease
MALFCVQIDYFAMNLALPRMAVDLNSTATDLQWVISVYMLTLGAFMVPAGRIGDIFGRRRALLAGIALFGLSSVLCAGAVGDTRHRLPRPAGTWCSADLSGFCECVDQRLSDRACQSRDRVGLRHSRIGQRSRAR